MIVDRRVRDLFIAAGRASRAADVIDSDAEPDLAQAALEVLLRAGVFESFPAPTLSGTSAAPLPESTPPVSVVVVSWNAAADLPRLLRSIRRQTYPDLEVIVVDNDSDDGSAEVAARVLPDASILRMPGNLGFGTAVNAGWEQARGELIVVLNADVELADDAVTRWVARALERPEAAAVAAKMMLASHPAFINSLGNSVVRGSWGSDNFMGLLDLGQFDHVDEVWGACFGAVLVRRSAVERVGGLDPAYFLYYEDLDWSYRARLAGYAIVTAPAALVWHRFGSSIARRSELFKLRLVVRNRIRYVALNMAWWLALPYLTRYLYLDFRQVVRAVLTRNPHALGVYVKAYWELARELPRWPGLRRRRRSGARADERRAQSLNIRPPLAAHSGGEAVVSEAVIRAWYLPLFGHQASPEPARLADD